MHAANSIIIYLAICNLIDFGKTDSPKPHRTVYQELVNEDN